MLFDSLAKSTPFPLLWIVGPEPPATSTLDTCVSEPRTVESILDVFKKDQQQFMERCHVNSDQIKWLAEQTKEQQKSLLWGKHRQLRLTVSNFDFIVAVYDSHQLKARPYPPSLFKSLMGEYNLAGKDSILWGQMHEQRAIEEYIRQTGNSVKRVGLILLPCGFLGCSPDGIITVAGAANEEHGVPEVKCPW